MIRSVSVLLADVDAIDSTTPAQLQSLRREFPHYFTASGYGDPGNRLQHPVGSPAVVATGNWPAMSRATFLIVRGWYFEYLHDANAYNARLELA